MARFNVIENKVEEFIPRRDEIGFVYRDDVAGLEGRIPEAEGGGVRYKMSDAPAFVGEMAGNRVEDGLGNGRCVLGALDQKVLEYSLPEN